MVAPPRSLEPEIAIAERASERDLPHIRRRRLFRRRGFERSERAGDLAGLMIEPSWLVPLGWPEAALVDQQDRGIHQPVGQRLQAQGGEPRAGIPWHDAATAGTMIEIFKDDPRIEQHRAILEHEGRDLSQRILLSHGVARVHCVGRLERDLSLEPEHARGDPYFPDERRTGRAAERQHRRTNVWDIADGLRMRGWRLAPLALK